MEAGKRYTSGFKVPPHCSHSGTLKSSCQNLLSISMSPSGRCFMPKLALLPGSPPFSSICMARAHCQASQTSFSLHSLNRLHGLHPCQSRLLESRSPIKALQMELYNYDLAASPIYQLKTCSLRPTLLSLFGYNLYPIRSLKKH